MEDLKTDPMEMDTGVGPSEETPAPTGGGTGGGEVEGGAAIETTGSLSETNPLANVGPPSPLTGCYLLIIIGEPHSEDARRVIIEQLKQGKSKIVTKSLFYFRGRRKSTSGPSGKFRLRHFLSRKIRSHPFRCGETRYIASDL